jgi:hydrogenase-4 component E
MTSATSICLILVVLLSVGVLSATRLATSIRLVAAQGVVLGILPPLVLGGRVGLHVVAFAAGAIAIKAVLMPWLLLRAMREAEVRREAEPFIGFSASLLLAGLLAGAAFLLADELPIPAPDAPLLVGSALATLAIGALVMVSRKKAVTQVLGYLLLENGIFLFGQTVAGGMPTLVELGILLDVLVGVFVMGIAIFHINREFDHMSVPELKALRD